MWEARGSFLLAGAARAVLHTFRSAVSASSSARLLPRGVGSCTSLSHTTWPACSSEGGRQAAGVAASLLAPGVRRRQGAETVVVRVVGPCSPCRPVARNGMSQAACRCWTGGEERGDRRPAAQIKLSRGPVDPPGSTDSPGLKQPLRAANGALGPSRASTPQHRSVPAPFAPSQDNIELTLRVKRLPQLAMLPLEARAWHTWRA